MKKYERDTLLGFPIEQTDMYGVGEIILLDWNAYAIPSTPIRDFIVTSIRQFYTDTFNDGMAFGL